LKSNFFEFIMEKRIALEKRGQTEDRITELNLDNCRSTSIEGLTDAFTALETLSLINVGLISLKNFPKLRSLKRLELSDNRISNGLINITSCENLQSLNLSGNRVKDIDELKPLATLEHLEILDLFNNEVTQIDNYREKLFEIIPSLKYLDGYDKNMVEAPSDIEDDDANGNDSDNNDDDLNAEELSETSDNEENDISLAEVYNDDLEDDNSDWNGAEEATESEDGSESEEDEARGIKRKLDE